jgi:hypothetical protein
MFIIILFCICISQPRSFSLLFFIHELFFSLYVVDILLIFSLVDCLNRSLRQREVEMCVCVCVCVCVCLSVCASKHKIQQKLVEFSYYFLFVKRKKTKISFDQFGFILCTCMFFLLYGSSTLFFYVVIGDICMYDRCLYVER